MGSLERTVAVLEGCLSYFQRMHDPVQVMAVLGILGKCHGFLGQQEQAVARFGEQLAAARALHSRRDIATTTSATWPPS